MLPYQIEITDPKSLLAADGSRHALSFTRGHGTDVLNLTDADLDALEAAIATRRSQQAAGAAQPSLDAESYPELTEAQEAAHEARYGAPQEWIRTQP